MDGVSPSGEMCFCFCAEKCIFLETNGDGFGEGVVIFVCFVCMYQIDIVLLDRD